MTMKIYTLNLAWRGCVVVTAHSLVEAKILIMNHRDYLDEDINNVKEHDLNNFVFVNYGDE